MQNYFLRLLFICFLLISFFSCSPKNYYRFQAARHLSQPISPSINNFSDSVILSHKPVLFPAAKPTASSPKAPAKQQRILPSGIVNSGIAAVIPVKGPQAKSLNHIQINQQQFHGIKKFKKVISSIRQKFPIVWFIILSALLLPLLIYFIILSSEKGRGEETALLFLIIPLIIPWLAILATALGAALGWPVFLTFLAMIGAIVLFILFVNWLTKVQEKARRARVEKAYKERQQRDPATY